MLAPALTRDDFFGALVALMPKGPVWRSEPDSAQGKVLTGLAPTYEASTLRASDLLAEGYPPSTVQLIEEWEKSLGLPDPCAGIGPTLQARRSQVVARFVNITGPSVPQLIAFAAALGFTITITEGPDPYHFTVHAPTSTVTYFRVDESTVGEPLEASGNDVLECEIRAIKPAHTVVDFDYT
jgi:uncharacterized protein YmfQ (DUF2313 family)